MRWSKVRQLTEASFADSVRGRVTVHVTNDDPRGTPWQDSCHRSWIQVDGEELVRVERHARRMTMHRRDGEHRAALVRFLKDPFTGESLTPRHTDSIVDLSDACWQYLHSSIAESLASTDPFIQSLAILSAKLGKQRLLRFANYELHPLVQEVLRFRIEAESEQAKRAG